MDVEEFFIKWEKEVGFCIRHETSKGGTSFSFVNCSTILGIFGHDCNETDNSVQGKT